MDLNATIASRGQGEGIGSRFRTSDGATYGEWEFRKLRHWCSQRWMR